MIAGVAGGLSERTGIDATLVRVGFVLLALASGLGVVAYVVAWLLLPFSGETTTVAARAVADRRGLLIVLSTVPVLLAVLVVESIAGAGYLTSVTWAVYLCATGLTLVYRNADDDEQRFLRHLAQPVLELRSGTARSKRTVALRIAAGAALLVLGLGLLSSGHSSRRLLVSLLGGLGLVVAAVVVWFGAWWLRLTRDLVAERQARIRAEERAEMAARVHDSVLQTLALVQRSADQPDRVVALARAQERELRSWLFEGRPTGSDAAEEAASLSVALERVARDVEAVHHLPVDVVTVGDCELDDGLRAMVAAGKEAAVNAAKWSGASVVSVYAEVEPGKVTLFVRDRGAGFDPEAVASDRHGISSSIRGRLERVGGLAEVRSSPGAGTEVVLTLARDGSRA